MSIKLDHDFYFQPTLEVAKDLIGDILYIEDRKIKRQIESGPRIGVAYAGECAAWPWRFWRKI